MTVEYPDLSDNLAVASAVSGTETEVVLASMKDRAGRLRSPRTGRQLE